MTAALGRPRLLVAAAAVCYVTVFVTFYFFETPGRGIGHFYYLPIALVALASGPWYGGFAGAVAAALWTVDALFAPHVPDFGLPYIPSGIRLCVFMGVGALIGTFATRNRELFAELSRLAERDQLTGLPNTRAFEGAITRRLESRKPFALLIGDTKQISDEHSEVAGGDALRRLADKLATSLRPHDEIARLGATSFAILTNTDDADEPARLSARLERVVAVEGPTITFGWSVFPQDGENALSLYRAADERMYARKLIRERPAAAPRDLWLTPVTKV
jgi:diguanylate cyclase (GGDEF)-like protein